MVKSLQFILFGSLAFVTPTESTQAKPRQSCTAESETLSCEARCARSLAGQCLITQFNFEGRDLTPGMPFLTASFLTCKNADVDLQLKDLTLALDDIDNHAGAGIVYAKAVSNVGQVELRKNRQVIFEENELDGRKPRLTFTDFLNSGTRHIDIEVSLDQCGASQGGNSCTISGKLVAVTNPNIRCDYHDASGPGAYIEPSSDDPSKPSTSRQTIGRITAE